MISTDVTTPKLFDLISDWLWDNDELSRRVKPGNSRGVIKCYCENVILAFIDDYNNEVLVVRVNEDRKTDPILTYIIVTTLIAADPEFFNKLMFHLFKQAEACKHARRW